MNVAPTPSGRPLERLSKGASIRIEGLSKHYGPVPAVDNISLEVKSGEFLSLLGPSGSGKTTLLMMIAGFETASAGAILLDGRNLTYVPPNKRGIGMVFQRYALFPHMSVADNIAFPLKMRNVARADISRRVEDVLAMVRLSGYGERLPAQLSGGQQQRVAVARALVFEPPVLLMDEPLGALDKKLREELQIEVKKLHDEIGVTIIYVTHDQEEALTMSDRIAVMNRGRIEQLGTPRDLYDAPQSPFVADFIGKMNFIPGRTAHDEAGERQFFVGERSIKLGDTGTRPTIGNGSDPARLAIRPEHLRIVSHDAPDSLAGIVDTAIFVGSFTLCIVRLENGTLVQVQSPSSTLLQTGQPVGLRIDSGAALLYASETE